MRRLRSLFRRLGAQDPGGQNRAGAGADSAAAPAGGCDHDQAQDTPTSTSRNNDRHVKITNDHLCGVTDTGRVRERNEDGFYLSRDGRLLAVVDGMGGHDRGDLAAQTALCVLADCFARWSRAGRTAEPAAPLGVPDSAEASTAATENESADISQPPAEFLERAFIEIHLKVQRLAAETGSTRGMGATLIAACVGPPDVHVCHVGDVRAYRVSGGSLAQITADHSVVASLVASGRLEPEEARTHPYRNRVLQAVGMPGSLAPESNHFEIAAGDLVLLCSDGLWEALADQQIEAALAAGGSVRDRAVRLVDAANAAGARDNITVVLYECPGGEEPR